MVKSAIDSILKLASRKYEIGEVPALLYRFLLLLAFYGVYRLTFYLLNSSLFPNVTIDSLATMMWGGIRFDTSALIYLNLLYFIFYTFPNRIKFKGGYPLFLKIIFLVLNGIGLAFNAIDLIYYRFILKRTTYNVWDILRNEENMDLLWFQFLKDYWYIALFFGLTMWLLSILYSKVIPRPIPIRNSWLYGTVNLAFLGVLCVVSIIGIRGGYRHSTRPITLSNAAAYVQSPEEMAIVLNTPFTIIRTIGKKSFQKMHFFDTEQEAQVIYNPVRPENFQSTEEKPNVVILILESFSREFVGSLNTQLKQGSYTGYTPFLDSLFAHSLVFTNGFANGRKSIDAMPSILAGLPALVLPYVVSEYSSNKINSIAQLLSKRGYETAFFHGAPNGSMGFDAFAKLAGFQKYYGKTEYANDADFDGIWGIWDHAFLQYYALEMNKMQEPFMTSVFTVSSHHPFKVPAQFQGKFPKGELPVQECIGYSDYALQQFFNTASQMPWYENTIFILTADHSSVPEHAEYKTNTQAYAVPIAFYSPKGYFRGRDNRLAQQIDILPTLMSYLKVRDPYVAFGNNLLDPDSKNYVLNFHNEVYQFMHHHWVIYFDGKTVVGTFDSLKDPELRQNLAGQVDVNESVLLMKSVIQQYNNRMMEDRLTP